MIVNNLYIFGAGCRPTKTNSKLFIDPDTELSQSITL